MVDRDNPDVTAQWMGLIREAKAALPCRTANSRHIWERFREFNRRRGHESVPAGYLLGFMRNWRGCDVSRTDTVSEASRAITPQENQMRQLMAPAPFINRYFHESDLKRAVGEERYEERVRDLRNKFGCSRLQAQMVAHGMAVAAGTILR